MARGKASGGTTGTGKKRGRPSASKKDSVKEENNVVDAEGGSDNEDAAGGDEDIDVAELPGVPKSVQASRKVIIAPKEIRSMGWEIFEEIQMKHPRTNNKALFLFCTDNNNKESSSFGFLFEVLTMEQETRSWFVNNDVLSDGNLYICTPVDPLFMVLPILAKSSSGKPIEDHLTESNLPRTIIDIFVKRLSHKQLENIAVKKVLDDIIAFVYSEEKALTWLSIKTEKVAEYFSKNGISHTEASVSSNFVISSVEATRKEDSIRYACDIVGEYIDDDLKKKLLEKFGLPVLSERAGLKRKNEDGEEVDNENSNKKPRASSADNAPLEDYGSKTNGTTVNKATKVTAREQKMQKAAQGSHSLFKFFSAKSK